MIDMSHSSHQHSISFLLSLCRCLFIKRRVKARFPTTDIDKHRTSQVCPDCHHRLLDVCMKDSINGSAKTTMGLKWCESVECKGNRLKTRDESSCYCIFQKGEDGYHEIFNHAGVGDEHYWEGPADRHVMSRYGMTASRKNGRRKDDDYDMELERKVQKNKRKNKRKKRNKLARGHANEYEMRMAYA